MKRINQIIESLDGLSRKDLASLEEAVHERLDKPVPDHLVKPFLKEINALLKDKVLTATMDLEVGLNASYKNLDVHCFPKISSLAKDQNFQKQVNELRRELKEISKRIDSVAVDNDLDPLDLRDAIHIRRLSDRKS